MPGHDDLDLSRWLRSGEEVRWQGHPARAQVPWLPVVALVAGSLVAAGALAWTQPAGPGTTFFLSFLALIVLFNVGNAVTVVRRAYRSAELSRYVLTNYRAAVFEPTSRLVAETRADTSEFQATRSPLTRAGKINWGESDIEGPDLGPFARFLQMSSLRFAPREGGVLFAELANFDAAYNMAVAVRRDLGVATPRPVDPRVRGEPPVALGLLDSPVAGVLNVIALCVGSFTLACVAFLLGWTLLGPVRNFMPWPGAVLFVFIFPLFFWAIAISIGRTQRAGEALELSGTRMRRRQLNLSPGLPLPLNYLPRWAIGGAIAVFVGCWISGMLVFGSHDLPGQPSYDAATHAYTANDHGDQIPLSKSQYDSAVRAQDRLFLSVELAFMVVAVAAASDEVIRRSRSPYIHPSN
jgi:hypothetical protein